MTAARTSRHGVDAPDREAELPPDPPGTNGVVDQLDSEAHKLWVFSVSGMDCASCARTIEAGVSRIPGVERASVSFGSGTMTVDPGANGHVSEAAIVAAVERAGYAATLRDSRRSLPVTEWWRVRRTQLTLLALGFWIAGFLIERAGGSEAAGRAFYLAAMALVGMPVLRAAWFALRARRADMNVLMSIAAIGAVAIGEWSEGSSVLLLFSIGLMLQSMTLERTQRAIDALLELAPDVATVRRDGREVRVPVEETHPGDVAIVRPGERIPVDGRVRSGLSTVDQASITGESTPVEVEPGSGVFAGTINGEGLIEVESTRRVADSTLARIIHMVEEAQASRAPSQAFVDRFAAIYTPIVVAAAIVLAVVAPLITGDVREWVFRALVLLVVACPCALVISTPVALVSAIGSASRRGVLFKGGAAVEQLARVRTVAFDKTGTMTAGRPEVTDVVALNGWLERWTLQMAAAVEQGAKHPLGEGIVRAADDRGLDRLTVTGARSLPGRGAEAIVEGDLARVGGRRMSGSIPADVEATLNVLEADGKSAVIVGSDQRVFGVIGLADALRPTTPGVVRELESLNVRTVMLTGDHEIVARRVAARAGVDEVRAGLLPEEKVEAIAALEAEQPVAMVGDGINDAPALARASVGIAMGASGTDAAIEAADVALLGDDLSQLPGSIRLARKTLAIIRENVAASILVKLAVLVLTFVGVTSLWLAVLADVGMSLVVTMNALRLARVPSPPAAPPPAPSQF